MILCVHLSEIMNTSKYQPLVFSSMIDNLLYIYKKRINGARKLRLMWQRNTGICSTVSCCSVIFFFWIMLSIFFHAWFLHIVMFQLIKLVQRPDFKKYNWNKLVWKMYYNCIFVWSSRETEIRNNSFQYTFGLGLACLKYQKCSYNC